jgi:N-methylhydantoinase A
MRYRGQSYEISFPYTQRFGREFHRRHEQRYGYADPSRESEVVTIRVRVRGISEKPRMPKDLPGPPDPKCARIKEKDVLFRGKRTRTRIYERALLRAGHKIAGPALIFEYSATTALPPGYLCVVDPYRNLLIH